MLKKAKDESALVVFKVLFPVKHIYINKAI